MLRNIVLSGCASFFFFAVSVPAHADGLTDFVRTRVTEGRYMSNGAQCQPASTGMLGWSADQLTRCTYKVRDTAAPHAVKTGLVYLANAPPERIEKWLTTACKRARPAAVDACIRGGATAIRGASGGQFPVSGLVWEDQDGDGFQEGYVFRNGVTVRIAEFRNASTAQPNAALLNVIADPATAVTGLRKYGGYARIMSTTREDYARVSGRTDLPVGRADAAAAQDWSKTVGDVYRAALKADENPLITARICANAKWPAGCRAN